MSDKLHNVVRLVCTHYKVQIITQLCRLEFGVVGGVEECVPE